MVTARKKSPPGNGDSKGGFRAANNISPVSNLSCVYVGIPSVCSHPITLLSTGCSGSPYVPDFPDVTFASLRLVLFVMMTSRQ